MKTYLILLLVSLGCGKLAADTFTDLKGNWKGTLNIDGANSIRFYLKITKSGTNYSGAMDDLDEIEFTARTAVSRRVRLRL